ncbi:MAG: hypothetical protein IPL64_08425 [Flavobacteriales bacterium]|nr:hypothetical protein [Flavobacteriales bacterium]
MSEERLMVLVAGVLIALALGFFIGLGGGVRQACSGEGEQFAGVRSYPVIAYSASSVPTSRSPYGDWIVVAGLSGLVALVIRGLCDIGQAWQFGITTELSSITCLRYRCHGVPGRSAFRDHRHSGDRALLSLKMRLHSFIVPLTPLDIRAFIQFVIVSAVILPFLPYEPMGPNGVWNLHEMGRGDHR